MVVNLHVTDNAIRIDASKDAKLRAPDHRVFFVNLLGFHFDPKGHFELGGITNQETVLRDVTDYLREVGVKYTLDAKGENLVRRAKDEESTFQKAHEAGAAAKALPKEDFDAPTRFKRPLKDHQKPAVNHLLATRHAANFSVPGSGKTTVVLAAFEKLRQAGEVEKLVVVGPRASFVPWEEEFQGCFQRKPKVVRVTGSKSARKKLYRQLADHELILLTYQMAANDSQDVAALLRRHKSLLVLDESHNIKRLEGGKWADALVGIAPNAERRVILSGTPVPNTILDLWSQLKFLWPSQNVLGTRDRLRARYNQEPAGTIDEVKREIDPLFWRTRKVDLDLPKPRFKYHPVKMSKYQQAIYDALAAKVLSDVAKAPKERERLRVWRKARMVRLLQAASNPALLTQFSEDFQIPPIEGAGLPVDHIIDEYPSFEKPRKIEIAVDLIEGLVERGEKVLVWTSFVHNIRMLAKELKDHDPHTIWGEVPKDDEEDPDRNREKSIREFKASKSPEVLIANPSACAESISLHKICHHAVYIDRTFNGGHYLQSLDRIHRVGLERDEKVYYHILISSGSIDEVIDERLRQKETNLRRLLDTSLSPVSLEDPRDAFSEEDEEDADFEALLKQLRTKAAGD